ncbi:hypothetical protein LFM09_03600 [Lentzea alba]|uniref:SdrD B-like domain-containing protein n=1 Tax=Lentzea alba TaxID=2714351 RepID=UPI0039BF55A8
MYRRPIGLALAAALVLAMTGTAHAQEGPSLRTTLEFDKSHYALHDTMRMKFTIRNVGGQAANRVLLAYPPYPVTYDRWDWAPLTAFTGAGVRVEPGETRVVEISGGVADRVEQDATGLTFSGYLAYEGRQNNNDDSFSASATITPTRGDISGVVYTDHNRNGRQDAGEAAAGTEVRVWGARRQFATRITDADGRFLFEDAPGGRWTVSYSVPGGWVVPFDQSVRSVLVTPDGVDLSVRAARPVSETLKAGLKFDKDTYQPGEQARITVTLANNDDRPIRGVQAACRVFGKDHVDVGPEWGKLAPPNGVNLWTGAVATYTVVEQVPQEAVTSGELVADCRFGPHAQHSDGLAEATARASVPGGFGQVNGALYHDANRNYKIDAGEGIANTRLVLRDFYTGADVAETVTDANGTVQMPRMPAGRYLASVDGPWRYASPVEREIAVTADRETWRVISLLPQA